MKKTILITGGTGFLGSHLIRALVKQDYEIIVLKRSFSNTRRINEFLPCIKTYDIDLLEIDKIFSENKINTIIHTACCYGRRNESLNTMLETNTLFGIKVLECALNNKVELFVNTDTIFEKYFNQYTLSKRQFVEWLKYFSNSIKVANLKLEHMYGPGDDDNKFVAWLIRQFKENSDRIKLTTGIQKRDFVYITDVVSAFLTVINNSYRLGCFTEFEVGTGKTVEVRNFVEEMERQYKTLYPECKSVLDFGSISYRENEKMDVVVNISMLEKLKWAPEVNYITGINKMLKIEPLHQDAR
jgi:nucleoside-diphosphate-sugar epimerase